MQAHHLRRGRAAAARWWIFVALAAPFVAVGSGPGTTELVTVTTDGQPIDQWFSPLGRHTVSADGRFVVFDSDSATVVPGDTNGRRDVFVRDVLAGTTQRVSVGPGGVEANFGSEWPSISADGRYVAFH